MFQQRRNRQDKIKKPKKEVKEKQKRQKKKIWVFLDLLNKQAQAINKVF